MDVVELCPALAETPPAARSALPRCGDFKVRFQGLMWWGPGDWGNTIKGGLLGLAKNGGFTGLTVKKRDISGTNMYIYIYIYNCTHMCFQQRQ